MTQTHIVYQRSNCVIGLRRHDTGGGVLRCEAPDGTVVIVDYSEAEVRIWLDYDEALWPRVLSPNLKAFLEFQLPTLCSLADVEPMNSSTERRLFRIVLAIDDAELASLAWESLLHEVLYSACSMSIVPVIIRATPVRFAGAAQSLTLPLRILEAGNLHSSLLEPVVIPVFGSQSGERVARALRIEAPLQLVALQNHDLAEPRCSLDILHIHHPEFPQSVEDITQTENTEYVCSLGWVLHLVHRLKFRLLVLKCRTGSETMQARRLAAAVTSRGGPAVILVPATVADDELFRLYEPLVHNAPLDQAVANLRGTSGDQLLTLFAGGGREEALRLTRIGEELKNLAEQLLTEPTPTANIDYDTLGIVPDTFEILTGRLGHLLGTQISSRLLFNEKQRNELSRFLETWPTLEFEHQEKQGLLPLADAVHEMADMFGMRQQQGHNEPWQQQQRQQTAPPAMERFVNSSLWLEKADLSLLRINQNEPILLTTSVYHLEILVGPRDVEIYNLGARSLDEHDFAWRPEQAGVWLEIAVTGLDCELLGDPVCAVWLPRYGSSEPVYFAFRPTVTPIARLRFCIYHRQNIIQSWRFAMLTEKTQQPGVCWARALGLSEATELPDVTYLARLEYSLVGSPERWEAQPARALSIVANDLNGQSVITVKGSDTFGVSAPGDISRKVERVREALREIATKKYKSGGEDYRFGTFDHPNLGSKADLQQHLPKLAKLGRDLFTTLFTNAGCQKRIGTVLVEPGVIHVAQVLIEKVLPWGVIYDHHYDANRDQDDNGNPVAHETCLAAVGLPLQELLALRCGEHPHCSLHSTQIAAKSAAGQLPVLPDTVVCPLHFWGIRHIIELPAQQSGVNGETPSDLPQHISAGSQIGVVAGLHNGLKRVKQHVKEIKEVIAPPNAILQEAWSRTEVMNLLNLPDIDIAYLYCHARGGDGLESSECLELTGNNQGKPSIIEPGDFPAVEWLHHPLVFINGCHTAGFSPRALSPFVTLFVGRGAAGVVGTEIDVWEPLAGEFALLFFREFLQGVPAGEALRRARIALLAQNNPLGLVYTLYASAHLSIFTTK